eukprot:jgi/Bigna1/77328/fgenesh1_pg.47_\
MPSRPWEPSSRSFNGAVICLLFAAVAYLSTSGATRNRVSLGRLRATQSSISQLHGLAYTPCRLPLQRRQPSTFFGRLPVVHSPQVASQEAKRSEMAAAAEGTGLDGEAALISVQHSVEDLKTEYDEVMFKLQQDIEIQRSRIFAQRANEITKIPGFWQQAMMNVKELYEVLSSRDLDALNYMTDIRVEYPPGDLGLVLHFFFAEENPYFQDRVLLAHILPDSMELSPGHRRTNVHWTPGAEELFLQDTSSFFQYFGDKVGVHILDQTKQPRGNRFPYHLGVLVEELYEDPLAFYTEEGEPGEGENAARAALEGELISEDAEIFDDETEELRIDDDRDDGVYMDEEGNYVDAYGNSVFADGGYIDAEGNFIPFIETDDVARRGSSAVDGKEQDPAMEAMDKVMGLQDALSDLQDGFENQIISINREFDARFGTEYDKREGIIKEVDDRFWSRALEAHSTIEESCERDPSVLAALRSIRTVAVAPAPAEEPYEVLDLIFKARDGDDARLEGGEGTGGGEEEGRGMRLRYHLHPNGTDEVVQSPHAILKAIDPDSSCPLLHWMMAAKNTASQDALASEGAEDETAAGIGFAIKEVFQQPLAYYRLWQASEEHKANGAADVPDEKDATQPQQAKLPWEEDNDGDVAIQTGVVKSEDTFEVDTKTGSYSFHVLRTRPERRVKNSTLRTLVFLHGFLGDNEDWAQVMHSLSSKAVPPSGDSDPPPVTATSDIETTLKLLSFVDEELIVQGAQSVVRRKQSELADGVIGPKDEKMSRVSESRGLTIGNMAAALAALMKQQGWSENTLIGYSMGGRIAMYMALRVPDSIGQLVVISGSAGIENRAERDERRLKDELLARDLREKGLSRFLDFWYSQPMFEKLKEQEAFPEILERRKNTGDAEQLAQALEYGTVGRMPSLWSDLKLSQKQMLFVVGSEDRKFVNLARAMRRTIRSGLRNAGNSEAVDGLVQISIAQRIHFDPVPYLSRFGYFAAARSIKNFDLIVGRQKEGTEPPPRRRRSVKKVVETNDNPASVASSSTDGEDSSEVSEKQRPKGRRGGARGRGCGRGSKAQSSDSGSNNKKPKKRGDKPAGKHKFW